VTPHVIVQLAPMLGMLAYAAFSDLRARKIPNWLTASLAATGIAQSMFVLSSVSPGESWAGLGVGFALTFMLFALGALGGGDVKLFAGIGAWMGPVAVFWVFAIAAMVGTVTVAAQALLERRVGALLRNSAVIVLNAAATGDLRAPPVEEQSDQVNKRLPYAVPALLAVIAVLLFGGRS
jgi:prepilin peptidase CpaA